MPSIQIFKPGTVTSMEGAHVSFSEVELQGVAERYDPALHEAPFIVGHPQHDAPAYGWVKALSFADGALAADAQQMDDEFSDLLRKGRFKKVSARFYTPASANNPTPGHYYLRDVGFLGAMAPAVKGLRQASFADDGAELVTAEISFADLPAYAGGRIASMFRRMRDWLIDKEGQETADRLLPDWEIEGLREISQRAEDVGRDEPRLIGGASFADPNRKEPPAMGKTTEQLQAELDAANARNQVLLDAERKRQADTRHAEHVSFADALVEQARWPAGAKDVLVASLDHLATPVDSGCVSFGDGEAARPLHEVLREQLQALPESVSFAEVASKGKGAGTALTDAQVSARASNYRASQAAKGNHISMGQAIDAVQAGTDKE